VLRKKIKRSMWNGFSYLRVDRIQLRQQRRTGYAAQKKKMGLHRVVGACWCTIWRTPSVPCYKKNTAPRHLATTWLRLMVWFQDGTQRLRNADSVEKELRDAFVQACRAQDRVAADVLRDLMPRKTLLGCNFVKQRARW